MRKDICLHYVSKIVGTNTNSGQTISNHLKVTNHLKVSYSFLYNFINNRLQKIGSKVASKEHIMCNYLTVSKTVFKLVWNWVSYCKIILHTAANLYPMTTIFLVHLELSIHLRKKDKQTCSNSSLLLVQRLSLPVYRNQDCANSEMIRMILLYFVLLN